MKANELRIGNYLHTPDGIGQVSGVQDMSVTEVDEVGYAIEQTPPIPLTEEWLNRFGFKNKSNSGSAYYLLTSGDYGLGLQEGLTQETRGMYYYFMTNSDKSIKIESVHQLQNLYHALTGEELKTK